jgi:hypothetical protein
MAFLIAALAGGAYQSLAVGRLELLSVGSNGFKRLIPQSWYSNAWVCYNIMVVAFHLGVISSRTIDPP